MKIFKTFFALATLVLAVAACTKDELKENPAQNGNISVEITGSLGELLPADNTKGSVSSVVRLNWTNGDKVYAFDATRCLGSLTAIVDPNNKTIASLSGTIGEPAGGIITIVYTNISNDQPEIDNNGKISFDFSEQTLDKIPFVAYATMVNETSKTSLSGITIPFSFASSVMKVSATGLIDDVAIDKVFPGGVNTVCELTLSNTDAPAISGTAVGNITLTKGSKSFSLAGGKTIVSFGVVKTGSEVSSDTRDITFKQGIDYRWSRLLNDYEITEQKAINTVVDTYVGEPYVEIEADYDNDPATPNTKLKWYKENLALTESGKRLYKSFRQDGTNTGFMYGDYFQWGAYAGYCGSAEAADKGLLIYESFNSLLAIFNDDPYGSFIFKSSESGDPYSFTNGDFNGHIGIAPYLDKSNNKFTKYFHTSGEDRLEMSDDAANIILGDRWRTPTSTEFAALMKATYWVYSTRDKGWYVFTPNQSRPAGVTNYYSMVLGIEQDSYTDAILFFPLTGYAEARGIYYLANTTFYMTSVLHKYPDDYLWADPNDNSALWCLEFGQGSVGPIGYYGRFNGYMLRAVSD
ncbi:MAG: hypothetical protein KBS89_02215 [Bacteroidales bacterium]|nr:hypothetical protein [Candidatus Egerieousia equi]